MSSLLFFQFPFIANEAFVLLLVMNVKEMSFPVCTIRHYSTLGGLRD